MTYAELATLIIRDMTPEQRNSDVTFFDNRDEFIAVHSLEYTGDNDILDVNHPYLSVL